jgi:chitodextrinase
VSCSNPSGDSSTTFPADVTNFNAVPGNEQATLTWTNPTDAGFDHVEITFTPAVGAITQPVTVTAQSRTITGLANDTEYTFTVTAVNAAGNKSAGVTADPVTPNGDLVNDITPPAEVTGLNAEADDGWVTLTWTDPADSDFAHVEITFTPAGGAQPLTVVKGVQSRTVSGLTNDTEYTFTVKTVDTTGNESTGANTTATPIAPPPEPDVLTSLTDIAAYLAAAESGTDAEHPVPLAVNLDLFKKFPFGPVAERTNWEMLLEAIQTQTPSKYVSLDLTACTMDSNVETEGAFDPETSNTYHVSLSKGESLVTSLTLPDAATSIINNDSNKPSALVHFTSLKTVKGNAVTTIGDSAFYNCTVLETAEFPKAETIDDYAFYHCTKLKTGSFPQVTEIGDSTFYNCTVLETANFPKAETIGYQAFYNCIFLEMANFPKAETIGNSAFYHCDGLKTANFPKAETIGYQAFVYCTKLEMADFPEATSIGDSAFYQCEALEIANFPLVTEIGNGAFVYCTKLEMADFSSVISIPDSFLRNYTSLKTAIFTAAETIGDYAFGGCTALETVSLPAATTIGDYAFSLTGTTKALTVTLGAVPPELGDRIFSGVTGGTKSVTVKVPDNTAWSNIISAYNGANTTNDNWGNAFRGGGWDGDTYLTGTVNENISLTIEVQGGTP